MQSDFQIGGWVARPHLNRLERDDEEVRLEPKAMQVLSFLADNPGQVVAKSDLLKEVWNETYVTEEVLANSIWEIRKALGDDARNPSFIQTVPKRGYRLIAEVTEQSGEVPRVGSAAHRVSELFQSTLPNRTSPRWLRRTAVVAGITALVVVTAFAGVRLSRPTEVGVLEARTLAVLGFTNHIRDPELEWLPEGVSSMLQTGLAETRGLEVVSSQRIRQIVDTLGDSPNGVITDPTQAKEVARRAGAAAVLVGSVFQFGSEIRIDARVEDVTEGKILIAHSVRGNDVFRLVDDLTERVRESLDLDVGSPTPGITEVTTASLEAYRLYKEGVEARRHLRLADARRLLTQAVTVDTNFALAYWELQKICEICSDPDSADDYRRKMQDNIDRLPDRKKLLARAEELYDENPAESTRLLEGILDRYPDEEDAYVTLSHRYRGSYDLDKYMTLLERGVAAIPNSGYLRSYYGYGLLSEARYPEAIRQFEAYARINPSEPNPYDSLGETYLIAGLPQRAIEEYGRALEIDSTFSYSNLGRAWAHSTLGSYDMVFHELAAIGPHLPPIKGPGGLQFVEGFMLSRAGRYREAEQAIDRGLEIVGEDAVWKARFHLLTALLAIEKRNYSVSSKNVEAAMALLSDPGKKRHLTVLAHLLAGVSTARAGDLQRAHQHLASLKELHEPRNQSEKWWFHLLQGEIALAEGDNAAAQAAFLDGEPQTLAYFSNAKPFESVFANLSFRVGPARAKKAKGDLEGAIEIYSRLIRPDIAQKWTAALEPRHVLELAALLEESGDAEGARRQYQRFLELWQDADQDLPELGKVRSRLRD